ncbi:MAG TPA: 2-oxoglutarate dehydrogenase E1 component [Devosia sp.]|jgi:2-oxoglutarate dehydrogenase E1 component|nr:2-oxoglutarate dehydrogenase E1 component [Devosia sp.]
MTRQEKNDTFLLTSFLYGGNADYIEQLYSRYKSDPASVDETWQSFFGRLDDGEGVAQKNAEGPSWERKDWPQSPNGDLVSALDGNWGEIAVKTEKAVAKKSQAAGAPPASTADVLQATRDSIRAIMMIRAYRMRGHLHADLDPLQMKEKDPAPELDPANYGFTEADYGRKIFIDNYLGIEYATIPEMLAILRRTYCGTVGIEFMHISDPEAKQWIQERIEGPDKEITFTAEGKKAILNKLIEAEGFEKFIDVKYTGTKRFGLDGAEATIPALEQIIKRGGALGIKDIVLGMAHRGRLNVLTQVLGKPHRALFHEFKGGAFYPDDVEGSGDVKYHLGASSDREFDGNKVHLSLTANPSHLEIVDPVVLGKARAKQDQHIAPDGKLVNIATDGKPDRSMVLPLLIHGDAAFAGQGVVAECLGLSGLKGHRTGGSIHFVINNQIGFTTAPMYSRSSPYPTDVAKMIEAPVLHVNGDDPEAVVFAAKVAVEYRQKFGRPVVIDMICYRRFGHNEGDEPSFTQPLMYSKIRAHKSTLELYSSKLVSEGLVTNDEVDQLKAEWRSKLEGEFDAGQDYRPNKADWLDGVWKDFKPAEQEGPRRGDTGVELDRLKSIGQSLTRVPEGFNVHKTVKRFLDNRLSAIESGEGIDWATAEALAFGSLVTEGHPVRLSGQDVERGTFSQRHSVLNDQQVDNKTYTPLNNLADDQCRYEVINSMLSEEAVLGFEYGYSLAEPKALTIWEAQFGDFVNGAQVVIDQFISSGERKWFRMSGLVMLLPHGYEGQGPEHSSARPERFLQLCAEDNMQVANCTTPANYFHALRRQVNRDFRKPLVLMTPKSLLRHKRAVSGLDEMGPDSCFHRLLWDDAEAPGVPKTTIKLSADDKIRRVVLCTGKVYYDLLEDREKRGIDDVYLLRVEQLYPFPAKAVLDELNRFKNADIIWCQEEPKNMGAWAFIQPYVEWVLDQMGRTNERVRYVGRPASASTATGLMRTHLAQLQAFLDEAFAQ